MADDQTQTNLEYLRNLVDDSYSDGSNNRVAYYEYVEGCGHGGLARGESNSTTFSGRGANAFLTMTGAAARSA